MFVCCGSVGGWCFMGEPGAARMRACRGTWLGGGLGVIPDRPVIPAIAAGEWYGNSDWVARDPAVPDMVAAVDMAAASIKEGGEDRDVKPVIGVGVEPDRLSGHKQERPVGSGVLDCAPQVG